MPMNEYGKKSEFEMFMEQLRNGLLDSYDGAAETFRKKEEEKLEFEMLMEQLRNGELDLDYGTEEAKSNKFNDNDLFDVKSDGTIILTKDSFRETAEDIQSIEARGKVLDDLKQSQTSEKSRENQQEKGE